MVRGVTLAELRARLEQDEDAFIERKETPHQTEVVETVVAFANSTPPDREAVLFLGQRADMTVVGLAGDVDKLQRKVDGWIASCYPPIKVHLEVLKDVGPDPVLAVVVPGSKDRPHFAGPAWVRVGSMTKRAPPELYEELIASRNTTAGAILRHKGKVVAVDEYFAGLYGGPPALHTQDYRIEDCTAQSVDLYLLSAGTNRSVPLEQVTLSKDPQRLRPLKLIIKPLI